MVAPRSEKDLSRKVLVTGAAGFIGGHAVRALCRHAYSVRALVHNAARAHVLRGLPVEISVGDILDEPFMRRAASGMGAVVHLAAMIRSPDKDDIYRTNVGGTRNLIRACEERGVKRFIFMSTPQVSSTVPTDYGKSKFEAEKLVRGSTLDWTVLRPVLVYGPGDRKDLSLMARIAFRWRLVPIIGGGRELIQPVYVGDMAEAVVKVIEKNVSIGKIYEIAGPSTLSLNDFMDMAALIAGRRCFKIHIPLCFAVLIGFILEKIQKSPVLTREVVKRIGNDKIGDVASISQELGITPISVEEGLRKLRLSSMV